METVVVSTEVLYAPKKRYSAMNSPYNIDFWKEVKKRWLVFGVLAAILLAVISPETGAPGGKQPACSLLEHSRSHCTHPTMISPISTGPLHTEYLSYLPCTLIYYNAGCGSTRVPPRLALTAVLHAHLAAPALCACTITMFRDALHGPVISGALLSSLGGGCAWLTLGLCPRGDAAAVAAACCLASLLATPLSVLLLCGRTIVPPVSDVLRLLAGGVPLCAGAALRAPTPCPRAAGQAAALALLYVECCARLADAAASLYVGDLLATLLVEVVWVCVNAGACGAYARWWGPRGARLIAVCAVPSGPHGWTAATACGAPALAALPAVFAAPAQAVLLAAVHAADEEDCEGGLHKDTN